ncbi:MULTISPECIES: hypothetical protein [unclassified Pseudomonas]|uniref:hypothetical protein n=1 Tax=unclassified Pseudomonas TaxID=196821 RepID=UPI0028A94A59|nr:hypothetical protein [Pseudomonas sp.]
MKSLAIRAALVLALLGSYWLAYEHGRSVERATAGKLSAERDSSDRLAEEDVSSHRIHARTADRLFGLGSGQGKQAAYYRNRF